MNKSQLRKLAREFALGKLDEEGYRQKRRDLIGGIVNGSIAIVREAPPPPPPPQPNENTIETELEIEPGGFKLSPVYVAVGVAVVAVLIWLFYPSGGPDETTTKASLEQPLPVPQISRARVLVEEFVAAKDWGEYAISRFKDTWNTLSEAERAEALESRWFNDLTNTLSEEIKTQNALLGFDESGDAAGTGRRLANFAAFLGVADNVTEFKGAVAASGSKAPSPAPEPEPQTAATVPSTDSVAAVMPTAAPPTAEDSRISSRRTVSAVSGARWLDGQSADAFTLQLFAVNHLDKIQQLIAANPDVDLQVLVSAHSEPRYRVIHGAFDSAEQAQAAHAALPASIRQAQPTPMVKTIGALRQDVSNGDWIASLDASKYTLQLFATDNSDNARRFVMKYPKLSLSLLDTTDPRSRYRVLYGAFESEASAKQAAGSLPAQLVRDAGEPLVKSVSELQAARR